MTKAELKEALDLWFEDDEVVVCADEDGGGSRSAMSERHNVKLTCQLPELV